MAVNTHVYVGPTDLLPFATKITASTCAPGSTQYMHGVINFANSGSQAATVNAKQWAQGDVIVAGISYDLGPAPITLSFPGQAKTTASPNPNTVYWLAPEYTSLWHLSWYFAYFGVCHQIDIPLGFANGTVQVSRWAGFIPASQPLVASSIVWQDSESHSFTVSNAAQRLPEFTFTNPRFIPSPGSIGTPSYLSADFHSNIPAAYTPYVFSGITIEDVNAPQEPQYRSIRHPVDATWWNSGGGGKCCNCRGYPLPPPNGCNGQDTWSSWSGVGYHGWIPSTNGEKTMCMFCFNMPNGI